MSTRAASGYIFVGAAGAVAYITIASLLSHTLLSPFAASVSTYLVLIPTVYFAQRNFAFQSNAPHKSAFPKYAGTQISGIILSAALPPILSSYVPPTIAFTAVAGVAGITNFFLLRFWAFKYSS